MSRMFILRDSTVNGDGKPWRDPALLAVGKPASTAEEVTGYVWDTTQGKAPKEQPLKVDDHGCDAMRYVVMHTDVQPRPGVRFM
jgi:phage terminase large subunit